MSGFGALPSESQSYNRYIISSSGGDLWTQKDKVKANGGEVLNDLPIINGFVAVLPTNAVGKLKKMENVRVEEDTIVEAYGKCSPWPECRNSGTVIVQPPQELDWGVDRIDADLAWANSEGSGIDVAVIDTGIDRDHEDLTANLKGGVNFVSKSFSRPADPTKWDDDNGHGTHVAGTIASVDNSIGVKGVAPKANLWAVKVLNSSGSGYMSNVIAGIDWAVANNMDVVNMSLGAPSGTQSLEDAVNNAYNAGVVVVVAAGNEGDGNPATNNVGYPAKYASVIAVGAVASDDSHPYWSSDGEEVEISAPGVSIHSTWNNGLYNTISGTSMATPHVVGAVALLLATPVSVSYDADLDGVWDPAEVRQALRDTAEDLGDLGKDNFYGYGLVDAEALISL